MNGHIFISLKTYFYCLTDWIDVQKTWPHSSDSFCIKMKSRYIFYAKNIVIFICGKFVLIISLLYMTPMPQPLSHIHKRKKTNHEKLYNRRIAYKTFDYDIFVIKLSHFLALMELKTNKQTKSIMKKITKNLEKYLKWVFIFLTSDISHSLKYICI